MIEQFRQAIECHGLQPGNIEPGRFHRFPGVGKADDNQAGWARLFDDGASGSFGDWSTGFSATWEAEPDKQRTPEEQEAYQRQVAEAKQRAEQERQSRQAAAAKRAEGIWKAAPQAPPDHPYLKAKNVKVHGLRIYDDALVIPLRDDAGKTWSLQFIGPDGKKRFLQDGKKRGCYFAIGGKPKEALCVAEGFATAATIHEATGYPVAVAFDAGNLNPVAEVIRAKLTDTRLIVCADDDEIGIAKAKAAALAVGGLIAVPDFGQDRPEGATDFNDLGRHRGPEAVKTIIEAAQAVDQARPSAPVGEKWPEPSPLTVHGQADPYPLEALPGTIGAAVREVVDFVQCPVALGACSALAVVSTVAQGLVDVRRAGKLEGPTSLYLLAIADSGERKTTVDGFFSKPVALWEAEQTEAAKPDLKRYEAEQAVWDAKKSGLLAAVKEAAKGSKSTTELERKVVDLEAEKPYPPKVPRLLFGDSTPEALAHRLAHGWPVGGVLSSEAGMVFGGHAMGKDSAMRNMAMLNSLWGAEPLTIDRRSVPSFTVRGARLTMGLAVQSETVRTFLDSSKGLARGIGWLARFLIAWPESTQGERMFQNPPETWPNLAKFHRRLGALLDHPLSFNDQGELEPEPLELSPEAKAEWVAFHDEVEAELRPGRDMAEAKDVASKAADNAARLAALFHLFENDPGGTIGLDHMKAAASLASWHLYEARRFMGEIALPLELNNAAKLDAWLLGYCQQNRAAEVSTRDIQQLGPNCTREKRTLDPALGELEEAGRVRVVALGRRSRLVKVNPALLRG